MLLVALGVGVAPLQAEPIVSNVGVLTRLLFTDNLFLQTEEKESAPILQILPNISGGRQGNRASYRYFYGPSAVFYGGGYSELNQVFQVLQADAAVDLIDQYLGLRMTARANQVAIEPGERRVGFDALGNPNAFTQTASFTITPVIRLPIVRSDFATVQIEPGLNYQFTGDTVGRNDSQGDFGSISRVRVRSGEMFSRFTWGATAESNVFNRDDSTRYQTLIANLGYRITDQWQIQGLAGYDDGNYLSQDDTRTPRWRITPVWTPSPNTSVGVGYGERYGGTDWYMSLRRRFTKATLSANYEVVLSDSRTELLNEDVVQFEDPFGDPVTNPAFNQDVDGTVTTGDLLPGTFVLERLRGVFAYRSGRNNFTWQLRRDERDYQAVNFDYSDMFSYMTLRRALDPRSSAALRFDVWNRQQDNDARADFTQYRASVLYTRRLSRKLQTAIRYSYTTRESDAPRQNYNENRIVLTLNWNL